MLIFQTRLSREQATSIMWKAFAIELAATAISAALVQRHSKMPQNAPVECLRKWGHPICEPVGFYTLGKCESPVQIWSRFWENVNRALRLLGGFEFALDRGPVVDETFRFQ